MTNLNVYTNYLNSLTKHIISILLLLVIINFESKAIDYTYINQQDDTVFVSIKSPWGAVLRSAIIPGWGQIYNQSYWKAPIIWGVTSWFIYVWNLNNDNYWEYQSLFSQNGTAAYKTVRDFYRDQRDLFAIYIGLTYLLNLIDAYVDAHLFDFTVTEDFFTKSPMLNMRIKF